MVACVGVAFSAVAFVVAPPFVEPGIVSVAENAVVVPVAGCVEPGNAAVVPVADCVEPGNAVAVPFVDCVEPGNAAVDVNAWHRLAWLYCYVNCGSAALHFAASGRPGCWYGLMQCCHAA